MSKRITRKTIQGKQTYKENSAQTGLPKEQIITRNGPNLLEQGANIVGMMNVNPLVKLGANMLADLCDDNPFQKPVQKIEKQNDNPVKQSIETQVQKVQEQVKDIVDKNVSINNVCQPKITSRDLCDPFPEPIIEQNNDSHTNIEQKYSFTPSICKQEIYDSPETESKTLIRKLPAMKSRRHTRTRTITGKSDPASFAYNKRMQAKREMIMKDRNLKPMFQPPNASDIEKQKQKYPEVLDIPIEEISDNPYNNL